jgi:hypothetical protein
MTQAWTQKECEKLYQHYMDKTGHFDFRPAELAAWAKANRYEMPLPKTDVEILAELLGKAGCRVRRKDVKTSTVYRGMLAYSVEVQGERKTYWFDADGPSATLEKIMNSVRHRREQALNILVSAAATVQRWKRTHSKAQGADQIELGLGISDDEVNWRLLGRSASDDESQQAG